jgi:hypothetical protein
MPPVRGLDRHGEPPRRQRFLVPVGKREKERERRVALGQFGIDFHRAPGVADRCIERFTRRAVPRT